MRILNRISGWTPAYGLRSGRSLPILWPIAELHAACVRCWIVAVFCMISTVGNCTEPPQVSSEIESTHQATVVAESLQVAIDQSIQAGWDAAGVSAVDPIDDAQFLRRVTLDLAGRVPTLLELDEFQRDRSNNKREQLVDRLLTDTDFAFHQRNEMDQWLLARLQWNNEWRSYLLVAMQEERPWDRMVREILLPERFKPNDKGAAAFLKQRVNDLDALTNDTSSLLFGVNVACAKCHDHPLVPDWHQDHYFGMASFFKRTFGTRRGSVAERFEGEVKFTTTKGEEKKSKFMFLDGRTVEESKVTRSDEQWKEIRDRLKKTEQDDKAEPPPEPDFSPRRALVQMALEHGWQSMLSRNMANRLWARFMGRGLVHPLDQMHSGNPPSHPELLDHLARELVVSGYDPRPVIKAILLSDAYARDSRWTSSSPPPAPELFAVFSPRPLTPWQYSLSLWLASRNPETLPGLNKSDTWGEQRKTWEQKSEGLARRFEIPGEMFQVSVEEALMLSNSPQIDNDFLSNSQDKLVGWLLRKAQEVLPQTEVPAGLSRPVTQNTAESSPDDQLASEDHGKEPPAEGDKVTISVDEKQRMVLTLDLAFRAILAREPTPEQRQVMLAFLTERPDNREAAMKHVVWALLTSAEFRFNH